MLDFIPNTSIRVEIENSDYIPGKGEVTQWDVFRFHYAGRELSFFPCEWRNAFGDDLIRAETEQIKFLATVRMGFNPDLLEALNSGKVRIYRNGETDPQKAYTVYGSCDNVGEQAAQLEFKVRREQVK